MQVTKERAAPATARLSKPQRRVESSTDEPTPATCGTCKAVEDLYTLGSGFLCVGCIGEAVSMAANDLFSGEVTYSKAFETAVLM